MRVEVDVELKAPLRDTARGRWREGVLRLETYRVWLSRLFARRTK